MSEYKPVPVAAAGYISHHCEKDVVVIGSIDHRHGRLHVTTYGRTVHDKVLAADAGEVVGNALSDMSRVERFEGFGLEAAAVKDQRDGLLAACELALKFWHSDHPNDTYEAMAAKEQIETAIAKAKGQ